MNESHTMFPCGDLMLEGAWHLPAGEGPFPAVVVCHPHPLYGGSMSNNVVLGVCQALVKKETIAFRFNFRGTGRSQGSFGGGIEEQQDVMAALDFVSSQPKVEKGKIGIAAYSFGSVAASPVAPRDKRVRALALISPPLPDATWQELASYPQPKLVLSGSQDMFVSPAGLEQLVSGLSEPKQLEIISGADHFWWGYEEELGAKVATFFHSYLK